VFVTAVESGPACGAAEMMGAMATNPVGQNGPQNSMYLRRFLTIDYAPSSTARIVRA